MRLFDPACIPKSRRLSFPRTTHALFCPREEYDARWFLAGGLCHHGGELTLDMLDLRYDATANYYEAPLHVKALAVAS